MPLLLVLAIVAACYPLPWQPILPLDPLGQCFVALGLVVINVSLAGLISGRVIRAMSWPPGGERYRAVQRFHLLRKLLGYWNLLSTGIVITLGWGWTVWHSLTVPGPNGLILCPGAELLVPAPYFLTLFVNWAIYWYAESRIELTRQQHGYWPLLNYWWFQFRKFAIVVLLPALLMTSFQGLNRLVPHWVNTSVFQLFSLSALLMIIVLLPHFVKVALGWVSLPRGPIREHLEATISRHGVRYTDLLLWPTSGTIVNAMVSGLVSWSRYIVFTDRILEQMSREELNAILGHELGHVLDWHIPYYTLFLLMSALTSATLATALPTYFHWTTDTIPADWVPWLTVPAFLMMGVYYFVVFGLLSRRCERQADVHGARAGSCGQPNCSGHHEHTELAANGQALCRTGILNMVAALEKVGALNGWTPTANPTRLQQLVQWMQFWQHGPLSARVNFLMQLMDHPELAQQHDDHVRRFRWSLMIVLASLMGLGISLMGWSEFFKLF